MIFDHQVVAYSSVPNLSREDIRRVHSVTLDSYMPFTEDRERDIRSCLQTVISCRETGEDGFHAAMTGWVGLSEGMSDKSYKRHCEELRTMLATAGIELSQNHF